MDSYHGNAGTGLALERDQTRRREKRVTAQRGKHIRIRQRLSHPIIFVLDFTNDAADTRDLDPQRLASSNGACVSIRTIADVDGEVTAVLAKTRPPEHEGVTHRVFAGDIDAPSGTVSVATSENEKLLELVVEGTVASLEIFVDNEEFPTKVWIVAGPDDQAP